MWERMRHRLASDHSMLASMIPPSVHREGWPFVIICAVVTIILGILWGGFLWVGLLLVLLCYGFFRDPDRVTGKGEEGLVMSPADGVVQAVRSMSAPQGAGSDGKEMMCISIFMSVLNVHVNRIPVDGCVVGLKYHPGKFMNASFDKASFHNERQAIGLETLGGKRIVMMQIAGLIARRIVCDLEVGRKVEVGDRFGIIRFGSRVDVYVPLDAEVYVLEGQKMVGGETRIASLEGCVDERVEKGEDSGVHRSKVWLSEEKIREEEAPKKRRGRPPKAKAGVEKGVVAKGVVAKGVVAKGVVAKGVVEKGVVAKGGDESKGVKRGRPRKKEER